MNEKPSSARDSVQYRKFFSIPLPQRSKRGEVGGPSQPSGCERARGPSQPSRRDGSLQPSRRERAGLDRRPAQSARLRASRKARMLRRRPSDARGLSDPNAAHPPWKRRADFEAHRAPSGSQPPTALGCPARPVRPVPRASASARKRRSKTEDARLEHEAWSMEPSTRQAPCQAATARIRQPRPRRTALTPPASAGEGSSSPPAPIGLRRARRGTARAGCGAPPSCRPDAARPPRIPP